MAVAAGSIGRLRRWLDPWLETLAQAVRPVHAPLLRAMLLGLLRAPSCYVADVARGLGPEYGPTLSAREHRLLRFLQSPKLRLESLKAFHRSLVAQEVSGAPDWIYLYADLSDIAKPYARSMEGLDRVRDGSDHPMAGEPKRIVSGYWLNEVYVLPEPGRVLPVVFELYSLRSGETLSQTHVLLRGMDEAFQVAGPRGVWVADRGYDDGQIFDWLLRRRRHFLVRLQVGSNSRHLVLEPNGPPSTVAEVLRHLRLKESLYSDRDLRRMGFLGWVRVRLPEHPDHVLTMIVAHVMGHERPMALLTTLPVPDVRAARCLVRRYFDRWGAAEDPIRFLKQTFRLEKYLVASLKGMRSLMLLIAITMTLFSLLLRPRGPGRRIAATVESFTDDIRFRGYRLSRALASLLQGLPPRDYHRLLHVSGP